MTPHVCPHCGVPADAVPPVAPGHAPALALPGARPPAPEAAAREPSPAAAAPAGPVGHVTLCVLLYGDYAGMHRRCLGSILATTPRDRVELRVATNEVGPETAAFVRRLRDDGVIYKLYEDAATGQKYPTMRKMFYDPEAPLRDGYVVWFDDDTIAERDPGWFAQLCDVIAQCHPQGARLFGAEFFSQLRPSQVAWAKTRPWWRGRPLQLKSGAPHPAGNCVRFAAGGFWALETGVLRAQNVPDPALGHNGGDILIGLQVLQGGFRVKGVNARKQWVHTSSVERRGRSEPHFAMPGWKPADGSPWPLLPAGAAAA
jgi:hypothetical protein